MPFYMWTWGPRSHALAGGPDPWWEGALWEEMYSTLLGQWMHFVFVPCGYNQYHTTEMSYCSNVGRYYQFCSKLFMLMVVVVLVVMMMVVVVIMHISNLHEVFTHSSMFFVSHIPFLWLVSVSVWPVLHNLQCIVISPAPQIRSHDFWRYINLYVCVYICMYVSVDMLCFRDEKSRLDEQKRLLDQEMEVLLQQRKAAEELAKVWQLVVFSRHPLCSFDIWSSADQRQVVFIRNIA